MNYLQLIAEHDAIEAACDVAAALAARSPARPADATKALELLAHLLRDHLEGEDEVIYQTLLRARGGRHAEVAGRMGEELARLRDDWESYLYRWDAEHVAAAWPAFADETADMLGRIGERVTFETMILYSMAVHLEVVPTG